MPLPGIWGMGIFDRLAVPLPLRAGTFGKMGAGLRVVSVGETTLGSECRALHAGCTGRRWGRTVTLLCGKIRFVRVAI